MSARGVESIYRLTPMQEGLLFHSLSDSEVGLYVEQATCTLRGALNPERLRSAWERVVDHHPALRASFHWQGVERPVQVVRRRVELPWREEDWRAKGGDSDLSESRFRARVEADRRRGFDLERPPLLRLTLVRTGERTWRLLWSYHHLLLDGWSLHLVLQQVFAAYEALEAGREPRLPSARPYEDHVAFLERRAEEPHRARAEAFWRRALGGFGAATPLPGERVDRSPGSGRGSLGARPSTESRTRRLTSEEGAGLEDLTRAAGVTLGTVVQGAWALLLGRWSGLDDVVFGTVVSGRPTDLAGAAEMVGLFINTLPVRVGIDGDERLLAWLRRLQESLVEVREHQHTPLAEVHRWSDVPAGEPLFESLFAFENYPRDPQLWSRLGNLSVGEVESLERTNYPLGLAAVPGSEAGGGAELELTYDPSRFGPGDAESILDRMTILLRAFGRAPAEGEGPRLAELPLLSPAEERRILLDWNAAPADGPEPAGTPDAEPGPRTLHGLVAAAARWASEEVAVARRSGRPWTYRELAGRAGALAGRLRERVLGPAARELDREPPPEPLVAVFLERSAEAYSALLGTLAADAAYLPLDPDLPDHRLAFLLDDARPVAVVTREGLRDRLPEAGPTRGEVLVDDLGWDGELSEDPEAPPERAAYVIYTSGSAGRPKGVVVSHGAALRFVRQASRDLELGPESRILQAASLGFDASVFEVFATLGAGGRLCPIDRETLLAPAALAETVAGFGVTVLLGVPSLLGEIPIRGAHDLPSVRTVVSGGERCPPEVAARWSVGRRFLNAYGPTEATVYCARHELRGAPDPIPIGRPVAGTRAYVVDRRLRPVPPGAAGELLLGGAQLARGYLGRPGRTAELFVPHPFGRLDGRRGERLYRTGDLARLLPDGTLDLLGRIDHQVKIRGQRVEPGEVEAVLGRHPEIAECAVVAQGEALERRLTAFVVPPDGGPATPEPGRLRSHLAERLPAAMIPATFVAVDELPRTVGGKIDRRELAERETAPGAADGGTGRAPAPGLESSLARIWSRVLGVERVGADDEFFALGGDSILAIRVLSRAAEEGISMTPRLLFENPTVSRLAAALEERAAGGDTHALDAELAGPVPLTPVQRRFFELGVEPPGHWTFPVMLTAREPLSPPRLARALSALYRRHDALRLRFRRDGSGSSVDADAWSQWLPEPDRAREGEGAPFSVVDLGGLSGAASTLAFAAASDVAQRSLDLDRSPLRSVLFTGADGASDRLLMVIHHLAVDAVSWRVLVEELERAYRSLATTGGVHLPPRTLPFSRWARRLTERGEPGGRDVGSDAAHALWRDQLPGADRGAPDLPLDGPRASEGEADVEGEAESVPMELDPESTGALLDDALHSYGSRPEELILTALARALGRRTGGSSASLLIEGHGRPDDVDLSRTVGWLTVIHPVRLEARPGDAPGEAIKGVKERLRSLSARSQEYGLLRSARPDGLGDEPRLAFNYLGRLDLAYSGSELFVPDPSPPGVPRSPRARRAIPVEVAAWVQGDRLRLLWRFGPSRVRRATVEALAADHLAELRGLIDHCLDPDAGGFTPSDFPAADLDQDALDRLVGSVGGDPPDTV